MINGWHNLTDHEYNSLDCLRSSDLSKLLRSPLHYSQVKEQSSTPAQVFGSLVHMMVLQPTEAIHRVKIIPKFNLRTNAGKEEQQEFLKTLALDSIAVSQEDYDKAKNIQESVLAHPSASKMLKKGIAEIAGVYNGMKIKPDYRRFDGILVDLKTTIDASPNGFGKSVANYNYAMQAAFYMDIANNIGTSEYHSFTWIAVEKDPPYAVATYVASQETIEMGRKKYTRALKIYNAAKQSGRWHGYPDNISVLKLPGYAFYDGDEV